MACCDLEDCEERGCYAQCYTSDHKFCPMYLNVQEAIKRADGEADLDVRPQRTSSYDIWSLGGTSGLKQKINII